MGSLKLTNLIEGVRGIEYESLVFSGGEVHLKLQGGYGDVLIESSITSSNDIMMVLMANDALKRIDKDRKISLLCPYIPYARQDRVMVPGEPLSIKVFADLINSCGFDRVYVIDPHSDVSTALINNCVQINWATKIAHLTEGKIIISPDQGAAKKLSKFLPTLKPNRVLTATKDRDVTNGKIKGIRLDESPVIISPSYEYWVIDDICDGGRTFIELAKIFPETKELYINLYITHGIFSMGVETIKELKKYYKRIVTTNSIPLSRSVKFTKDVEVINITMGDLWPVY